LKLARISLAIIISLLLAGLICPAVQAGDNKAEVDLKVTVVPPPPPPPPAGGGGGGAGPAVYYIETNLFGIEARYRISSQGKILETIEAISEDGMLTISVPRGTIALDKDGRRLKSLSVLVDETPPPPPEGVHIIGLAYDFEPKAASFAPPIPLTWGYDPDALREGVAEEDLVLAYYDEDIGKWIEMDGVVDTENNIITASISHSTTFAIFGYEVMVPPVIPVIPAEFTVSDLFISPTEVNIGERVSISLIVANTGGELGSYKVTLKINGVVEATKEVTVHAGFSKELTFTTLKDIAGTYSVDIDGLIGSFRVKEKPVPVPPVVPVVPPPPKVNWAILGPILGVVVFLAIFLPIRTRRRRRAA